MRDDILSRRHHDLILCMELWLLGHKVASVVNAQALKLLQEAALLLILQLLHLCVQKHLQQCSGITLSGRCKVNMMCTRVHDIAVQWNLS